MTAHETDEEAHGEYRLLPALFIKPASLIGVASFSARTRLALSRILCSENSRRLIIRCRDRRDFIGRGEEERKRDGPR
jgi:hypothetical protein